MRTDRHTLLGSLTAALLATFVLALSVTAARAQEADPSSDTDAAARRALRRTPVVEAVENTAPAVVSIGTKTLGKVMFFDWVVGEQVVPGALGSGVLVHPDGYVVTNAHVINRAVEIYVKLTGLGKDEREIPATLVDVDPAHDLALLRLNEEGPYPALTPGRSDDAMVGESVIALGSPFGLGRTVSTGVVSATRRDITVNGRVFAGLLQTDAAVNQGNSGGALLNVLGEWIGVNSAIYSLSGGSDGISFAIPIETVREFLAASLRPRRRMGIWVGLEFGEVDHRPVVSRVFRSGPATEAGVEPGARLLAVDGKAVTDLVTTGFALLESARGGAGAKVRLTFATDERPRDVELAYAGLPTADLAWRCMGARLLEPGQEGSRVALRDGSRVVVADVRPEGAFDRAGLRRGDVLTGIDDTPLHSVEDLLLVLDAAETGDIVDVSLVRPWRDPYGGIRQESLRGRVTLD